MGMSDNNWASYVGKVVMVQLRSQPYIGVTGGARGEDLEPTATGVGEFMSTPVIRGIVRNVFSEGNDSYMVLETTDPDQRFADNKVFITLSFQREIGYTTYIEKSRISV